jgi:hypothetical protein
MQITDLQKPEWSVFLRALLELICNDRRGELSINKWLGTQCPVPYDEDFAYAGLLLLASEEQKMQALIVAMSGRTPDEQLPK